MTKNILILIILPVMLLSALRAAAQADGSVANYGGSNSTLDIAAGSSWSDNGQTLFIGPGDYQIDGTWFISSEYVYISAGAHIFGAGSMQFHSPQSSSAGSTFIDGNDAQVDVNVSMGNTHGLALADILNPGFASGDSAGIATLRVSRALGLDSGFVFLNGNFTNTIPVLGNSVSNGSGVSNDLIIDSVGGSGSIAAYDESHYAVTNNSIRGHVVARFVTPVAFTFPVGISSSADYTPATLTPAAVQNLHVSVTDYAASSAVMNTPQNGMNRTWHIFGDAAVSADVTLQHNTVTDGSDYNDNFAFITQYLGSGQWSSGTADEYVVSSGVQTADALSLVRSGAAAGSWFTKISNVATALPITLVSFQASKQNNAALLQWITASEINNKGFEVQHSTDAQNWSNIAFVNSEAVNGNSSAALDYSFTDNSPANGNNYYRLQIVSLNGAISYSDVRNVDLGLSAKVYPVPASSQLNVSVAANSSYQLIDILGRTILSGNLNAGNNVINVSGIADGAYLLRLMADNKTDVYKILIRR